MPDHMQKIFFKLDSKTYARLTAIKNANPGVDMSTLVSSAVIQWLDNGWQFKLNAPIQSANVPVRRANASAGHVSKSENSGEDVI